ncbi:VOC family protein [Burkholderia anthina]|uniref:VOC family protein n=1 Tax=Burkholderia anthina TaxID=179879 RepID=UPI00158EBDCA|nr:VOC family protein [Burkholderia anthina]
MKFHHVAFIVSDLEEALKLWRDVLGFTIYRSGTMPDTPPPGQIPRMTQEILDDIFGVKGAKSKFALLKNEEGAMIELQQPVVPSVATTAREQLKYHNTGTHEVAFQVENIEFWFDKIKSAGYEPNTNYIWPWAGTGKSFLFYDQDGNMIQFNQQNKYGLSSWEA